jgi:hypothetical protein
MQVILEFKGRGHYGDLTLVSAYVGQHASEFAVVHRGTDELDEQRRRFQPSRREELVSLLEVPQVLAQVSVGRQIIKPVNMECEWGRLTWREIFPRMPLLVQEHEQVEISLASCRSLSLCPKLSFPGHWMAGEPSRG